MLESHDLYTVVGGSEAPHVDRGVPLVLAIPGISDAGSVCKISASYLLDSLDHERLVEFHADELIDYRSSRPQLTFDRHRFEVESFPRLVIDVLRDGEGKQFLLMSGSEPDLRWQGCAQAIIDVCDMFEVSGIVSIRAVPAEVPHTRMIPIIAHANSVTNVFPEDSDSASSEPIEIPGSFPAYLETVAEVEGIGSRGFVAQIPHYLGRFPTPAGALALLRKVSDSVDLDIPLVDLGDVVEASARLIESEVSENSELIEHVRSLEGSYDATHLSISEHMDGLLDVPTGSEIADRLERFLAEESKKDDRR